MVRSSARSISSPSTRMRAAALAVRPKAQVLLRHRWIGTECSPRSYLKLHGFPRRRDRRTCAESMAGYSGGNRSLERLRRLRPTPTVPVVCVLPGVRMRTIEMFRSMGMQFWLTQAQGLDRQLGGVGVRDPPLRNGTAQRVDAAK